MIPFGFDSAAVDVGNESEIPPAPKLRPRYLHGLADYEHVYGMSYRGLKKWIGIARRDSTGPDCPPDFPPLDQPTEMAGWWARHSRHPVPAGILQAAALAGVNVQSAPPAGVVEKGAGVTSSGPISRLRRAVEDAHARWEAMADTDPQKPLARKGWLELEERWQKSGEGTADARIETGELVVAADLASELTAMLSTAGESLRAIFRRIHPQVQGRAVGDGDAIYQAALDGVFRELHASKFAQPLAT